MGERRPSSQSDLDASIRAMSTPEVPVFEGLAQVEDALLSDLPARSTTHPLFAVSAMDPATELVETDAPLASRTSIVEPETAFMNSEAITNSSATVVWEEETIPQQATVSRDAIAHALARQSRSYRISAPRLEEGDFRPRGPSIVLGVSIVGLTVLGLWLALVA